MQENARRIVRPDEVKTLDNYCQREPDRYFYLLFEENVWECDGYCVREEGKEPIWTILIVCPLCKQNLKIDSTAKKLLIDERGLTLAEPIACSWPGEFSTACNFRVAIEPPQKREDRFARVTGPGGVSRQVKIDAVAHRV
jgi:hypothetical protein